MSCCVQYIKDVTKTDVPTYLYFSLSWVVLDYVGATYCLPILTNVVVRSYDWA
jgi:hypothetical protein